MTKVITKNSFTTGAFPTGLSAGELAVNVVDKILFVGNTFGAGVTLYNVNTLVTSVDGASGAITNVARTNTAQTFAGLQTMTTGISAADGYISSSLGVYGTSTSLNSTTTSVTNTSGLLTITPSTAPGAATLRLKADDGDVTLYDSDLIASSPLAGNIINYLPQLSGTLLNTTSTIYPSVSASNSSSTAYPLFSFGIGNTSAYIDNAAGTKPLKYVPSLGTMTTTAYVAYTAGMTLSMDSNVGEIDINDGTDRLQIGSTFITHSGSSDYTFQSDNNISLTPVGGFVNFAGTSWGYNFPTSAGSTGQVLSTNGVNTLTWQTISSSSGSGFTYASSAPGSPSVGDRWIDSDTGKEYVYVDDGSSSQWIEPISSNGLVGVTYTAATQVLQFGVTGSFVKLGVNTLTPQNTLDVAGGVSATSTTNTLDIIASTEGAGLRIAQATSGGLSRVGGIRLGRGSSAITNTYLENSVGVFTVYTGVGNTGTSLLSLNTSQASFGVSVTGTTFAGSVTSSGGYRLSSGAINAQVGTGYTLQSSDNGKVITMSNGSASTLFIPSGLAIGYSATVIQLGVGQVTITGSGTSVNSFDNRYNLSGQYASADIISYTTDVYNISGGLTA